MRILGIDPGLDLTGYGCVELTDDVVHPTVIEAGVFRLGSKRPMPQRLRQLHDDLLLVIDDLRPQRMVVEQLFSHYKFVRTSILMGHARGVVMLAGESRGLELSELAATEVKKAVTGNGHASKQQMQHAVMAQCNLTELPSPPDVADAMAVALCAARRIALDRLAAT